jgi:hypothetical protein
MQWTNSVQCGAKQKIIFHQQKIYWPLFAVRICCLRGQVFFVEEKNFFSSLSKNDFLKIMHSHFKKTPKSLSLFITLTPERTKKTNSPKWDPDFISYYPNFGHPNLSAHKTDPFSFIFWQPKWPYTKNQI